MRNLMKLQRLSRFAAAVLVSAAVVPAAAQNAPPAKKNPLLKLVEPWPEPSVLEARRTEAVRRPLFQQTDALPFTLAADFKLINKDRDPESRARYPGVLTLTDARGRELALHVRLSPRGHLRRMARTCESTVRAPEGTS
jgi:pimeloyl-ACP methyl ester carboxylesterase